MNEPKVKRDADGFVLHQVDGKEMTVKEIAAMFTEAHRDDMQRSYGCLKARCYSATSSIRATFSKIVSIFP